MPPPPPPSARPAARWCRIGFRTGTREEAPIARTPKPPAGGEETPPRRRTAAGGTTRAGAARPRAAGAAAPEREAAPGTGSSTPRKRQVAAGPDGGARPRRPKAAPDRLEQLVTLARTSLEDDKAEDIVVLDVTDRASFTDRMIIATGLVERQIQAMATHLEEALEKAGLRLRRDAIQASPDWVLIDAGDLVIHLFRPEARAMYGLERMWGPESPAAEAPPPAAGGRDG